MGNFVYILYALILGVVSLFTGEIVTFALLGVIIIALNNINSTLNKIYLQNKERSELKDKFGKNIDNIREMNHSDIEFILYSTGVR